ncbi:double-headed protease inhibitor, submandibular gland-like isoform X8 [Hemicordylus capensis]|uniref:double-headed protease inhibitor, submandibular gland-like isoform X8 n=1 Tax=Hemicordylus capensis TaxID=884348 RepID=UPI002303561D|nr:double-headed protease inhibitor, submandibular gland-like isoform X8 [Hemicordylus capensis]XP_053149599.1 double-headed protease inhibitor, submandibular gland-like isoform X8 [Hemicordylus capensis]
MLSLEQSRHSCPSIKGGSLEALQTAERMSTLMSEFGQGDREKRFTSWADTYYKIDCSIFNSNNCPRLYQPVCGSDGKTYDNLCVFCNTILRSNGSLVLRYLGECY